MKAKYIKRAMKKWHRERLIRCDHYCDIQGAYLARSPASNVPLIIYAGRALLYYYFLPLAWPRGRIDSFLLIYTLVEARRMMAMAFWALRCLLVLSNARRGASFRALKQPAIARSGIFMPSMMP